MFHHNRTAQYPHDPKISQHLGHHESYYPALSPIGSHQLYGGCSTRTEPHGELWRGKRDCDGSGECGYVVEGEMEFGNVEDVWEYFAGADCESCVPVDEGLKKGKGVKGRGIGLRIGES
jgi:hypothetical protein